MKKLRIGGMSLVMGSLLLFNFWGRESGSLKGTVNPLNAATNVWAMSKTDTVKGMLMGSIFEIKNLKTGNYSLLIEAVPPYKNFRRDDILVTDGQPTDIGDIRLSK